MSGPALKVVFICGHGRSGSTLLGNILGELDGWCSVGELRRLYEAMDVGHMCGCGQPIANCPFWTAIRAQVSEEMPFLPEQRILPLQQRQLRIRPRAMSRMVRENPGAPPESSPVIACARVLDTLYRGAAAEAGAEVLVDTSKGPHDAYLVERFTDVDLFLVHLVRDPRAVAYSWRRMYRRLGQTHRYQATPIFPLAFAFTRWMVRNALAELMLRRRLGARYLRVRYEDFAEDPGGTIARICALASEPPQDLQGLAGGAVEFGARHEVRGSIARFARNRPIQIELDTDWESGLSAHEVALGTLATWPLLLRYGYPLRLR